MSTPDTAQRTDAETARDPLVFDVVGMDCGDCARSVERVVGQLPDVGSADVSFAAGTLTVKPDAPPPGQSDLVRSIGGAVDRAGYTATLRDGSGARRTPATPWWRHRRLVSTGIATLLWMLAFAAGRLTGSDWVPVTLFAAAIAVAGYPIVRSGWTALRAGRIDMNVLMTVSVIGAVLLGEWSEGALVVVLFSVGTALQAMTFDRTRSAIRALLELAPEDARVLRDGVEMTVAASSLHAGDVVRVRPGERLPADGEVTAGHSAINQAAITGESMPVDRGAGDEVFAGTINGSGIVDIRVTKPSSQSMLANIVHLVEEAQAGKAPSQQLVDRFAAIYTPVVVVLAALIALGGGVIAGDWHTWVYRALVLLVIACPCALVISTPVSIVSAIGAATRQGMLVKGGAALEQAGRARTIAFDKTGTLTLGRPAVAAVVPFDDHTENEVLSLAAAVEQESEHPLARAIVARALHDTVPIGQVSGFSALPGRGARAMVNDGHGVVGSDRLMRDIGVGAQGMAWISDQAGTFAASGQSVLSVARIASDGTAKLAGVVAVADRMRPGVRESLAALRRQGVRRIVMLTGDREEVAQAIAAQVGADEVRANLLPDEKSTVIEALRSRYGAVAMVGDGINDAPALAVADVGIAMGVAGSDVALESADLALMRDDLSVLARLFDLSRYTVAIIRQNVTISLVIKALALVLGVLGLLNLWIAVLADVGTSIVVTFNGLRLARRDHQPGETPVVAEEHPHDHADHDHPLAAD